MAELLSLADIATIPSSMEPIHTGQSASLASAAQGILSILRRTKSANYRSSSQGWEKPVPQDETQDGNAYTRARTNSPVRANSKRRRSAAPNPGREIKHRPLGGASRRTASPSLRSEPSSYERDVSPRRVSQPSSPYTALLNHRSPSRGRTWRREHTPYPDSLGRARGHQQNERSNVSTRRQYTQNDTAPEQAESPKSLFEADDLAVKVSSYVTKGNFRLRTDRQLGEFRFPKSRSQPEPIWSAGDGFSDDEARPQFTSPMARKNKRKRSRSLSAFGQLSLEAEDASKSSTSKGTASSQLRLKGSRGQVSGMAKDAWPTRESFMEPSISKQSRTTISQDSNVNGSTPPSYHPCSSTSMPEMKRAVPRKREASYFENFGKRRRKSHSRHSRGPSLSCMRNHQATGPQASEEENEEDRNGPYEGVGDGNMVNHVDSSDTDSEQQGIEWLYGTFMTG
ncbi:hypothetical protein GGR55DRAFT_676741 [Xylaria sp. FL0064]|nr:hypothetical protein GGR55DRAFT_676741 [Xylaria sp. FL0064]